MATERERDERQFRMTDHICRNCGGRVLEHLNAGATPGGNPAYVCADCETASSGMGPDCICWCGMHMRHERFPAYRCLAFSEVQQVPELRGALLACGCNPGNKKVRVGIVTLDSYRRAMEQATAPAPEREGERHACFSHETETADPTT